MPIDVRIGALIQMQAMYKLFFGQSSSSATEQICVQFLPHAYRPSGSYRYLCYQNLTYALLTIYSFNSSAIPCPKFLIYQETICGRSAERNQPIISIQRVCIP